MSASSLLQQVSSAVFISTVRANEGDTAYVPTTAVYSKADEIVMPQDPPTAASGLFVLTSNSQVQVVCPGQPAGGNFTHEGMLYNPLTFTLAMDAITNGGSGQVSRLNLQTVCGQALAPGLTAADKSTTDATITEAAENILTFEGPGKAVTTEPVIKAYAQKDMTGGTKMTSAVYQAQQMK
jgi:hypothetical protein